MTDVMDTADTGADQALIDTGDTSGDSTPVNNDTPEIEALAAETGWKPGDQWKGEGHMSASDFLKHQAARAKDKSDEAKSLTKRLDKLARTSATILERQLAEQRDELEGRYADLVAANKPTEARRVAQQIDSLERVDDDPGADFKTRNSSWFEKDDEATALAFGICEREARKGTDPEKQLELAEAAVRRTYPHLFGEAPQRKTPIAVSSPASRSAPARSRQFTAESLPPEAKKALAGYLGRINEPAKKTAFTSRYLSEYNKENGQ